MTKRLRLLSAALFTAAITMALAPVVQANTVQPRYQHGRLWMNPEYDGAEGWSGSAVQYPGGVIRPDSWPDDGNATKRGFVAQAHKLGSYLFSVDWTDPDGLSNPYATSYMFRTYDYGSYNSMDWITGPSNFNYVYPGGLQFYRRWERPKVYVSGTLLNPHPGEPTSFIGSGDEVASGIGPYWNDIVDPNLVVEERLDMWWRYIQGVEYQRSMYGYVYGSAHQDYVIQDITLTNNGISGASDFWASKFPADYTDTAPRLTNQTLTGVIWAQAYDFKNQDGGTILEYNDNKAMYTDPWGNGNVALYWHDDNALDLQPAVAPYTGADWGDPKTDAKWNGHLVGNAYIMWGALFVSESPAALTTDLGGQPAFRLINGERGLDLAGKGYSPADTQDQRYFLASGDYQLPLDTEMRDDTWTAQFVDPTNTDGATGGTMIAGYGPVNAELTEANLNAQGWTIGFNESVNIVQVIAGGGIDEERARQIGSSWLEHNNNSDDPSTWYAAGEIDEIKSGEDTVRKAINLAYWNYYGSWASAASGKLADWGIDTYVAAKPAGHDKYDVPDAPRPPANFSVRARGSAVGDPNGGIQLRWSTEAEDETDFDTGVKDFAGYRVYRQEASRLAPWVMIADLNKNWLVEDADGDSAGDFGGRLYWDKNVTAGVDYWYAVTAYDDGSQNWAEAGKSLESGRYWTWTGYTSVGVTATTSDPNALNNSQPGRFELAQNAPNPFNPQTTINYSLAEAGDASLVIYGATGQVVRTLVDGSVGAGQHSVTWDGMDSFGRPVASGVYIYRLTAGDNVAHRRMTLVR